MRSALLTLLLALAAPVVAQPVIGASGGMWIADPPDTVNAHTAVLSAMSIHVARISGGDAYALSASRSLAKVRTALDAYRAAGFRVYLSLGEYRPSAADVNALSASGTVYGQLANEYAGTIIALGIGNETQGKIPTTDVAPAVLAFCRAVHAVSSVPCLPPGLISHGPASIDELRALKPGFDDGSLAGLNDHIYKSSSAMRGLNVGAEWDALLSSTGLPLTTPIWITEGMVQRDTYTSETAAAADADRFLRALAADSRTKAVFGFSPWPGQPEKVARYAFNASTPVGLAIRDFALSLGTAPPADSTCSEEVCETVTIPAVYDSVYVPAVTHVEHHSAVTHDECRRFLWFRYSCRTVTDSPAWDETVTDSPAHWQTVVLVPAHEETTCERVPAPCPPGN